METPIGFVPTPDALNRNGLNLSTETLEELLRVDPAEWVEAVEGQDHFLRTFGRHLPRPILDEHRELARRIEAALPHDGEIWP